MKLKNIDRGQGFDFGNTSALYAQYRDVYPNSMYDRLIALGIGKPGQRILDLGSGTAVLPLRLYHTGARFTATDISENQVAFGTKTAAERGLTNIDFKVCAAEDTGLDDNAYDAVTAVQCFQYFDAHRAAKEIRRVLKPNGIFGKIFMDWLPYEDNKIAEMERLVLQYNPNWSGGGFREFHYAFPSWAEDRFRLETVQSYDEELPFSKEAWLNRVLTCRGVGASLSAEKTAAFEQEYRGLLNKYGDVLYLKHQIHIEIYRAIKS